MDPKDIFEYEKLFGVIGYPIKQSLSGVLHNFGFRCFDLPYAYFKWEVPPLKLPEFMVAVDVLGISGLSVTIPHKETIIPYLDELTEDVLAVGAVNHVFLKDGRLIGHNTDIYGFIAPIKDIELESGLLLGSGGAARAAIWGLKKKNVKKILVCSRNLEKANILKKSFGIEVVKWDEMGDVKCDILINSTPVGMIGHMDGSPYPEEKLNNFKYVYDIVYNPINTRLLQAAKKQGIKTISGIHMFIHQALSQFKIWTDKTFDVDKGLNLLLGFLNKDFSGAN